VTEQDVINEEMYEEEDDDLPSQYRRLTAGLNLQTGNPDFNRRLDSFLTTQIAMRAALHYSAYPNAPPQYGNPAMGMFPSPMLAHQQQQQHQHQQQPMQQPMQQPVHQSVHQPMQQQPHSPAMYRQAPYSSPVFRPQGPPQNQHQRSASIATPQELSGASHRPSSDEVAAAERRSSMPAVPPTTISPEQTRNQSPVSSFTPQRKPSFPQGSFSQFNSDQQYSNLSVNDTSYGNNHGLFSTTLPMESQLMLGSFLSNDHYMMSSDYAGPSFDFSTSSPQSTQIGKQQVYPSLEGLQSTLAPQATPSSQQDQQDSREVQNASTYFMDGLGSKGATPAGTPGLNWGEYIEGGEWEVPASSQ
jgi:hypothetical protein